MKCDSNTHHRRSIRLKGYDYSQQGAYFVTICTQNRACLFGDVVKGKMVLNDVGKIVQKYWDEIPKHFNHVALDEFIVMPNHVHGIIMIVKTVGANNYSPLSSGTSKTIGSIVRGFKIGVTKWIRQYKNLHDVWQRNYYEHIVRNEDDLNRIREYIINNPAQWADDELFRS